tara:strand:- start:12793 stop:13053 length:261 start_codon:yes stop_codon:yes gene_type:complete
LQDLNKLLIGESVKEVLKCDLQLEQEAIHLVREAISCCELEADYISRELLADILEGEEEHLDWLGTQLGLIESMGLENFIQFHRHE